MKPRHAIALILVIGLFGAAYFVYHAVDPVGRCRYPELRAVPQREKERARRAIPAPREDRPGPTTLASGNSGSGMDGCTPRAVLAILLERSPPAGRGWTSGPCFEDAGFAPEGVWLAAQQDATLNEVLLRLAADEEIAFSLRDTALVALGWPGNEAALPGLVRLAMDMEARDSIRTRAFSRMVRIGVSPAGEFDDLLSLPFRRHDDYAAAVLAITGRKVAPGQIVEALRGYIWTTDDREHLLVRAAEVIATGDREIAAHARLAREAIEAEWTSRKGPDVDAKQAVADLAPLLERWLAAHPEATTSAWEQARRAYREGVRFARERSVLAAEDPAAIPEDEIDFAAAALLVSYDDAGKCEGDLAALDRMAALFRREFESLSTPQEKLESLHRRLLVRHQRLRSNFERGPSSFLATVLDQRAGNCVGLTSLYVALGERLGLPLVAVSVPRHVFLRWDDGTTVLDFELTDGGRLRTDAELEGAVPRVLSKRGLLSVVLSNRGNIYLESPRIKDEGRIESALQFADEAVAYDDANDAAHHARARCLARLGDPEGALAAARRALELAPLDVASPFVAAECLLLAGRSEEALTWFERARAMHPDDPAVLHGALSCLAKLGRDEEVIERTDAWLREHDHPAVRRVRLGAMVRLDRKGWRTEMAELGDRPPERWTLRFSVVEALLDRGATADALAILDRMPDLQEVARQVRREMDDDHSIMVKVGDVNLMIRAGQARKLWRRAQTLRAEAYDKCGRDEAADAIRRTFTD